MGPDDAPDDEMRRHPRNPVPPLDPMMVERILDGAVPEQDVPPDYRDVLRVLAAASAPAAPDRSGEAAALAAFRSARRPDGASRRTSVLSKMLGAKALAALVLGTASVGTAAAAAGGALPDQAQSTAHRIVAAVPDSDRAEPAGSGSGASSGSGAGAAAAGDHATGTLPGAAGLCQAYASGQGGTNGGRLDAGGFRRLAEAAGGADQIPAYCAGHAAAHPAISSAPVARPGALAGQCKAWLAADRAGRDAQGTAGGRLATAAGGPAAIEAFCAGLVGAATHGPAPEPTPAKADPPGTSHGDNSPRSTPAHPAPPTPAPPTPRG